MGEKKRELEGKGEKKRRENKGGEGGEKRKSKSKGGKWFSRPVTEKETKEGEKKHHEKLGKVLSKGVTVWTGAKEEHPNAVPYRKGGREEGKGAKSASGEE